jgi:hypothetical protein
MPVKSIPISPGNPGFMPVPAFIAGNHIIRNQKSFKNIRNYIKRNPEYWEDDELSPLS